MNGRKIERKYENPIDNLIIDLIDETNPYLYKLGFNPHILTTISIVIGLSASYFLYRENYIACSIFFVIAYIFDCYDGNFARRYDMVTKIGDLYDHIGDFIKLGLLLLIIFTSKKYNLRLKIFIVCILLVLLFLMSWHLGCQERIYRNDMDNNKKSVLTVYEKICLKKQYIHISKYFGCGTFTVIFALILLNLNKLNKLI